MLDSQKQEEFGAYLISPFNFIYLQGNKLERTLINLLSKEYKLKMKKIIEPNGKSSVFIYVSMF